jgi:hypothetical protein
MNNNTILRIKVPAHLYESVKNQLTLKEGKSSKSFGDWTVVKEKKTSDTGSKKEIKQTSKKVEEADDIDQQDRFADLGGNGIFPIIKFLLDDGFDIEDIIEKIKGHFSEEETDSDEELEEGVQDLKEYEVTYVYENGQCYKKDDEGNKTKVDSSKCGRSSRKFGNSSTKKNFPGTYNNQED